jgi:hypothetical protein
MPRQQKLHPRQTKDVPMPVRRFASRSRRRLLAALGLAGLAFPALPLLIRDLLAAGSIPGSKGVVRMDGDVRINGKPATLGQAVKAGDVVETGPGARAVFVVSEDAFLLRDNSRLELQGEGLVVSSLRILTGKLLTVFGAGRKQVVTTTATVGIRGTGLYVEADAGTTYICTCYGETELSANEMPDVREVLRTTHHDQPRYVFAKDAGRARSHMMITAKIINHSDEELIMLDALVGRVPPFVVPGFVPGRY